MPFFMKPLIGLGACALLSVCSFFAGMATQKRLPTHPNQTSAPYPKASDFDAVGGLGKSFPPPWEFDHNFKYPWSAWNIPGFIDIPGNTSGSLFQKPELFFQGVFVSKKEFIQSLKEQIQINAGHIINGELYDKNGNNCYVHCPEDRRIYSIHSPEYLLANVDYIWNYSFFRVRGHIGERLFHLKAKADTPAALTGAKVNQKLFLQGIFEPVWQWRMDESVIELNNQQQDALKAER